MAGNLPEKYQTNAGDTHAHVAHGCFGDDVRGLSTKNARTFPSHRRRRRARMKFDILDVRGRNDRPPAWIEAVFIGASIAVALAMRIAAGADAQPIDWQTSPLDLDLRGMNGERYVFACPPGKPGANRVAGSGPYADDSSICAAAVHAGALSARNGGDVTIEIRPGENRYAASERNDVKSVACEHGWSGSFVVVAPTAVSHP
jgi:hypothetical protein